MQLLSKYESPDDLLPAEWREFKRDMNGFGILKWDVNDPTLSVDCLDLTLAIKNGNIHSKSYQKPSNLCQYICRNSAPTFPGWSEGFSTAYWRKIISTIAEDYWNVGMAFYNRQKDRCWSREQPEPLFVEVRNTLTKDKRGKIVVVFLQLLSKYESADDLLPAEWKEFKRDMNSFGVST